MFIVYVHTLSDHGSPESGPNPRAVPVDEPLFKSFTRSEAEAWIASRKNPRWYHVEGFEKYELTEEERFMGCLTAMEWLAQLPTLAEYEAGKRYGEPDEDGTGS